MQSTTSVLKICIVINDEKSLKSAYFFENGPQPLEKGFRVSVTHTQTSFKQSGIVWINFCPITFKFLFVMSLKDI